MECLLFIAEITYFTLKGGAKRAGKCPLCPCADTYGRPGYRIGSFLAFFTSTTNTKFLSVSLGFSAGVMIYISMIEIYVKAQESLVSALEMWAGSGLLLVVFLEECF